jgi:uncharacterized Zn-binding protein involved in type VI secretion
MFKAIATHGSPTTTRGLVIANLSSMFNEGKRIAVDGDLATCGNCGGAWPIIATGIHMTDGGRSTVLDGDKIACSCHENRVIVTTDGMYYEATARAARTPSPTTEPATDSMNAAPPAARVDPPGIRRIFVCDSSTRAPLRHQRYLLEADGERKVGKTDENGYATIETKGSKPFRLHVVYASPKRDLVGHKDV